MVGGDLWGNKGGVDLTLECPYLKSGRLERAGWGNHCNKRFGEAVDLPERETNHFQDKNPSTVNKLTSLDEATDNRICHHTTILLCSPSGRGNKCTLYLLSVSLTRNPLNVRAQPTVR